MSGSATSLRTSVWVLLLAGIGFAFYLPALNYQFVYDDQWFILKNPSISHVFPLWRFFIDPATVAPSFTNIPGDAYRPLSTLSFAANAAWFGMAPGGFRLFNFFLHVLNGLLLWMLLRRWTGSVAAFLGAALFLLHPAQIESVVWISQRSILLCGVGCLAALLAWEKAREDARWAAAAMALYVFALFSKETALPLPLLFAFQLEGKKDPRWKPLVFFFVAGAAYYLFRAHVLGQWSQHLPLTKTWTASLLDGVCGLGESGRLLLWPGALNISHRAPNSVSWATPCLWGGIIILASLAATVFIFRKRVPLAALGAALFLTFWLPHSGLAKLITFSAERFLYLPVAGLAALIASLVEHSGMKIIVFLTLCGLSIVGRHRLYDWKNEQTLWSASVHSDPKNAFAWACYGGTLAQAGNADEAEACYKQALQNQPRVELARDVLSLLVQIDENKGDAAGAARWREKLSTTLK